MSETPPTHDELRSRFASAEARVVQRQVKALAEASGLTEADAAAALGRLAEKGWVLAKETP